MRIIVLLSAGRHPTSGAAILPRLDAQAIRVATEFAAGIAADPGAVAGLHAGPSAAPASDGLGHGLSLLDHLLIDEGADPLPALLAALAAAKPDLILAGRRGQGGDETGLLPYALARALSMAIVADAVALAPGPEGGTVVADQALPKGALRRLTLRLPAVVTVHPSAPPPLPFAFGQARRGRVRALPLPASAADPPREAAVDERPYRPRPKTMRSAPAGATAAERLKMATGDAGPGKANVLVHPAPEVAAREILAFLRSVGARPGAAAPKPGRSEDL